jgi:4-hydroxy-2-oxoheptanedioate aldolase
MGWERHVFRTRSVHRRRVAPDGGSADADYGAEADGSILCFAMIETREAYERMEEIAATPGLDGLYIGRADLTLGLTGRRYRTGFDREGPEMVEAIRHVLDVAHKAGIRAALHNGSAAYAAKAIGWGFDFVIASNDVRLLAGAAQASLADVRKLFGEAAAADKGGPGGY